MGDVIRFPVERRQENSPIHTNIPMEGPPLNMDECTEFVHIFNQVPGWCKCGQNEWTDDHNIEPDGIGIHPVFDPQPAS